MTHTRETMERTRVIETAMDIQAIHQEHTMADSLELLDLTELARIARERRRLDEREQAVWDRLWERNKQEDRRHEMARKDALIVCRALDGAITCEAPAR